MTDLKSISPWEIGKYIGIAALSLGLNHLITSRFSAPAKTKTKPKRNLPESVPISRQESVFSFAQSDEPEHHKLWGSLKLIDITQNDGLLQELEMMTMALCSVEKVNNLIVDLQLHDVKTYICPLVALKVRRHKNDPFLVPDSLVKPGEFVIQNCVFRSGQSIQTEKKFMRAGPRSTQYFNHKQVQADIICSGKVAPGINNIIRELVTMLLDNYKVKSVTGIKFSYQGYYDNGANSKINLTTELVETIHHRGGCFLGVSKVPFHAEKIVDSLVNRGINQVYLIGGNDTLKNAYELYKEIKNRQLNIALSVILKAINKDIAFFDTCFGFESAVEESQRFIEEGYALVKSNFNSVVLVKVPGRYSGFLAMDAVRAARNANICLVPEFEYDLYGERGLLKYVADRVKLKGYCIIVYSEGASYAARDIDKESYADIIHRKEGKEEYAFDLFLKKEIERELRAREVHSHSVFLFDSQNAVRTVPANSFDTKLCSQITLCSIQGLMCGYTNFAIGHLKNRVAMVPLDQMMHNEKYYLRPSDENWQRLLATTGQPSFINDELHVNA